MFQLRILIAPFRALAESFERFNARAICIEPTLFDELMLVMKFRVLQPCPRRQRYALEITTRSAN